MNDYQAVYKNTGRTPRSLNEAYKNAEYASPIYRHENREWQDAKNFFAELFVSVGLGVSIVVVGYAIYKWIGSV